MKRYNPKDIEPKWQKLWEDNKVYQAADNHDKPKKYILEYFPYPSGAAMHVGHVRNYTIGDAIARFNRMNGFNVLHPMGWDAFGLPAENYAIKNKVSPRTAIDENTQRFKEQLMQMGFSYDWSREINSTDPKYYRWTQWFFLLLFKNGLAYQQESLQWWCPFDKTVLANEQVESGKCWRCGHDVEKKSLKQWFFKITDYADRLFDDLDDLDWSDAIKSMQRNWIGRSQGAEISWQVCDQDGKDQGSSFRTFTTRKDTIPGVTFIVVAPESELLDELTTEDHRARVHSYRQEAERLTDIQRQETKEKSGVFTGKYAKNPFNNQVIPIYVANYVLGGYGTGVVMGMGGHDLRDREFSLMHDLPVVLTTAVPEQYADLSQPKVWTGDGKQINSGEYDGLSNQEAGIKIFEQLVTMGSAETKTNYKMRDWLISRQRYWGAPIPIIQCPKDGAVAVPEDQLPVLLPEIESYEPSGDGRSPLANVPSFVQTTCPTCGGPAERETDTMDGFACSSWYFLRFADPNNDSEPFDKDKAKFWLPVDDYIGGAEHAVMHLLYARFWTKVMFDQQLIEFQEPFTTLRNQGMILAPDGNKMSKSKGNTIEPGSLIDQGYGADCVRIMELFIGPWNQAASWSIEGMGGAYRFLQRVWTLTEESLATTGSASDADTDYAIRRAANQTIRKVTTDLQTLSFNTAIAGLMEYVNQLYKLKTKDSYKNKDSWRFAIESLLQLLAPFAPHIAEELWQELGHSESIHISNWPSVDETFLTNDSVQIAVQVNGKLRGDISVTTKATESEVVEAAKVLERVKPQIEGKEIVKTIYVAGKIVNLVVR